MPASDWALVQEIQKRLYPKVSLFYHTGISSKFPKQNVNLTSHQFPLTGLQNRSATLGRCKFEKTCR